MAKIMTFAWVPDALVQPWLQHLRDFDVSHPGCHFEVMTATPEKSIAQVIEMLQINPGLTSTEIFERKKQ